MTETSNSNPSRSAAGLDPSGRAAAERHHHPCLGVRVGDPVDRSCSTCGHLGLVHSTSGRPCAVCQVLAEWDDLRADLSKRQGGVGPSMPVGGAGSGGAGRTGPSAGDRAGGSPEAVSGRRLDVETPGLTEGELLQELAYARQRIGQLEAVLAERSSSSTVWRTFAVRCLTSGCGWYNTSDDARWTKGAGEVHPRLKPGHVVGEVEIRRPTDGVTG